MNEPITVNGVEYVPKSSVSQPAEKLDGLPYVLVRGDRSGVFIGYLHYRKDQEVTLLNMRHIWAWSGSANTASLAQTGTSKPKECKFTCEVTRAMILDCLEILDVTDQAKNTFNKVPVWQPE